MFTQPEDVEPNLIGEFDLLDQVAQPLMRADRAGARFGADIRECVEAEFHSVHL